jgi:hypothetical protein
MSKSSSMGSVTAGAAPSRPAGNWRWADATTGWRAFRTVVPEDREARKRALAWLAAPGRGLEVTRRELGSGEWLMTAGASLPSGGDDLRELLAPLTAAADASGAPGRVRPARMPEGAGIALLHVRAGHSGPGGGGSVTAYCDSGLVKPEGAFALGKVIGHARSVLGDAVARNPGAFLLVEHAACADLRGTEHHNAGLRHVPGGDVVLAVCSALIDPELTNVLSVLETARVRPPGTDLLPGADQGGASLSGASRGRRSYAQGHAMRVRRW